MPDLELAIREEVDESGFAAASYAHHCNDYIVGSSRGSQQVFVKALIDPYVNSGRGGTSR